MQIRKLSIVTPCHNEADNLLSLVTAFRAALASLQLDYEMIVVDDCSTDRSWEILKSLGEQDARIRGIRLDRNYGQSAALWAGIQSARGEYIATMDADLQNDPMDLGRFLEAARHSDCVCGSRIESRSRGDNFIRRLSSNIANKVRNVVTGENVSDSGCGYRVFRRECVQDLKFFKGMHRFLPTLFKLEGFRVTEIPVSHRARQSGRSHYNVWNRVFTTSSDLLAVWWMKRRMFKYRVAEYVSDEPVVVQPARRDCASGENSQTAPIERGLRDGTAAPDETLPTDPLGPNPLPCR